MKKLLKSTLLLLTSIPFISFGQAVHTVTVQNHFFSPSSFSASVGDTVEWVWVNGTHTTTSLGIPGGAASWSNNINSSSTTFKYKITTTGTYNYWCAIHTTMMEASFTVAPLSTPAISAPTKEMANIFPNPATNVLNIKLNNPPANSQLIVTDILGKEVVRQTLPGIDNTLDISTWKKGVYLYRLKNGEETMEGKLEVQ